MNDEGPQYAGYCHRGERFCEALQRHLSISVCPQVFRHTKSLSCLVAWRGKQDMLHRCPRRDFTMFRDYILYSYWQYTYPTPVI